MKIRPVGAELFYVDGRTHMTKVIVAFRNFAKAPNNVQTFPFVWRTVSVTSRYSVRCITVLCPVHHGTVSGALRYGVRCINVRYPVHHVTPCPVAHGAQCPVHDGIGSSELRYSVRCITVQCVRCITLNSVLCITVQCPVQHGAV